MPNTHSKLADSRGCLNAYDLEKARLFNVHDSVSYIHTVFLILFLMLLIPELVTFKLDCGHPTGGYKWVMYFISLNLSFQKLSQLKRCNSQICVCHNLEIAEGHELSNWTEVFKASKVQMGCDKQMNITWMMNIDEHWWTLMYIVKWFGFLCCLQRTLAVDNETFFPKNF